MHETITSDGARIVGRYALYDQIAAGGMAMVHLGRLVGPVGFARAVAIKRLHAHLKSEPEFVAMFLDEARLAAKIRHQNVVPTLDVVETGDDMFIVMEYVHGVSLAHLVKEARAREERLPFRIAASIVVGALYGLHAAHEARTEKGPLGIVHRDVSPQNVLVGVDGGTRVLDFGVAKAMGRLQTTREGQLKGKLSYMSPEQIAERGVTPVSDVFSAGVVLWETLVGEKLFQADKEVELVEAILGEPIRRPSRVVRGIPPGLDDVVLRALERDPQKRFASALEMARALEWAVGIVAPYDVADAVVRLGRPVLEERAKLVDRIESLEAQRDVNALASRMSGSSPASVPPARPEVITIPTVNEGGVDVPLVRADSRDEAPEEPDASAPPPSEGAQDAQGRWNAAFVLFAIAIAIAGGLAWSHHWSSPSPPPAPAGH